MGNKTTNGSNLMTIREVADYLRIATRTLRTWRSDGIGPRSIKIGGSVRYLKSDLLEWIEQQAVDGARDSASNSAGQQSRGATRHGRMDEA